MRRLFSKEGVLGLGLLLFVACFFLQKTNLAASDLGRHVKNGEVILSTGVVFSTNLYSYTNPEYPAPNHHWLFGVISSVIHDIAGFSGLTLMSAVLYTSGVGLMYFYTQRKAGTWPAVVATLAALPLLAHRSETRPEAFSLFFYALLLWLLLHYLEKKALKLSVLLVGFLICVALWVNIHIFFILVLPLLGAAFLDTLLTKQYQQTKGIIIISCVSLAAAFLNPLGLGLVLYPFQIFGNYGYRVSENQSLWFFLHAFTTSIHWYLLSFILLSCVLIGYLLYKHWRNQVFLAVLFIFFTGFTLRLIRMENILAVTAIPLWGLAIQTIWKNWHGKIRAVITQPIGLMAASILGFSLAVVLLSTGLLFPFSGAFGVGLLPKYDQSLIAVRSLSLPEPIFNNFDSGSFLIYALYPQKKVFIDNRAEAYPAEFLKTEYIKAQEDPESWKKLEEKYAFNSIIFYWHDQTDWGQTFLFHIFQDPSWVPIYVDNYILVLVKNSPGNNELIEKHQLPREIFSFK